LHPAHGRHGLISVHRATRPVRHDPAAVFEVRCEPGGRNRKFLEDAAEQMCMSPRAYQRILKVARTLADLENGVVTRKSHIAEALAYRGFDCEKVQG
jgi:magnesium chelatase family protein